MEKSVYKFISRIGHTPLYAQMAREFYVDIPELHKLSKQKKIELSKLDHNNDDNEDVIFSIMEELAPLQSKLIKNCVSVIVFSAMALEAYIYDYASRNLGTTFVQKHLDKLDLVSKYVIGIHLITSRKFPKNAEIYNKLQTLTSQRNKLVHSKSFAFEDSNYEKIRERKNYDDQVTEQAINAIETMDMIAEYIEKVDKDEPVKMFLKDSKFLMFT
jgi:hypothetical protein